PVRALRVPDALWPPTPPLGRARGRGLQHARVRALRDALVPLLLPPPARAEGERVLRAARDLRPMKAAVYRGIGQLVVEEVPRPEPGPGEMVVRLEASGI